MRQNRKSAKQVKAKRKANGIKSTSAKRCWTIGKPSRIAPKITEVKP